MIILSALAAFSCKDSDTITTIDSSRLRGKVALAFDSPPHEIVSIIARLLREGFPERRLVLAISDSNRISAEGTFFDVEAGRWHLIVEALDAGGVAKFRGEADVFILGGETTRLDLAMHPMTGNLEIHVHWANPPPFDSTMKRGLVLYMPFDGNTLDQSGRYNHGSSMYPSYSSDPWGNINAAYRFNGADNFITVPNSPTLNPMRQLTITMWLKVDSIQANYMPILAKGGPVYGYFNNREYGVWTKRHVENLWYPQFKSAGDSSGMHELDSNNGAYPAGGWTFFAFVVDRIDHRMLMYANGEVTVSAPDSYSNFNVNGYPLIIGWSEETFADHTPLNGTMDNLRIYNRALSPREIQYLYTSHM